MIAVVPRAGTWIETFGHGINKACDVVVPRAGTWIETSSIIPNSNLTVVVPRAGTWIETKQMTHMGAKWLSFPVRERGLKLTTVRKKGASLRVVPRAGTWIET